MINEKRSDACVVPFRDKGERGGAEVEQPSLGHKAKVISQKSQVRSHLALVQSQRIRDQSELLFQSIN